MRERAALAHTPKSAKRAAVDEQGEHPRRRNQWKGTADLLVPRVKVTLRLAHGILMRFRIQIESQKPG